MSSKTSTILNIIGFLLFFFGMMALTLSLMDVRISFMNWIPDTLGRLPAFLVHLFMIILGLVVVVAARGNFSGEDPIPLERKS